MRTPGTASDDRSGWYLDGDPAVGAVVLRCALLDQVPGVTHGFATRRGGVAGGLDFGARTGPEDRRENRRRLALRLGAEAERLFTVRQIHGARIVDVDAGASPQLLAEEPADGLVTKVASAALGVLTADCVPVLLAERRGRAIAAVHAGWRGLAAGVLEAAVARFGELGVRPVDLVAAIGPCIGVEAYEVGEEVATAFAGLDEDAPQRDGGADAEPVVRRRGGDKAHVDLAGVAARLLSGAGCKRVARSGYCTARRPKLFYSHRRDASGGRQLSVIGRLCPSISR